MKTLAKILLTVASFLPIAFNVVHAATTVQVVETYPAGNSATLGRNQNFYVLLHYQSDQPVQIWANPYYQGKPANAGSNTSRVYPAGSGEAMGWFFLFNADDRVDEIRIKAGDGMPNSTPTVATYPIQVRGSNQPAVDTSTPEWVTRLSAIDKAEQKAAYEKRMNEPVTAGDMLLFNGFMLTMMAVGLLSFTAPAWGLWRWRGGWRWAAAAPAAVMAFIVLRIIIDGVRDPTSHNLWPFEILMMGAGSVLFMLVLVVARKVSGK